MEEDELQRVWQTMDQLDQEDRLLLSTWLAGTSYSELAALLCLEGTAVRQRLRVIRHQIRKQVTDDVQSKVHS